MQAAWLQHPSVQSCRRSFAILRFCSEGPGDCAGDHNSNGNPQAAAAAALPHAQHAEAATAASVRRSSAPAALPPLFSRADSAPLATRLSNTNALAAALSGGLSGSLDAPHAAASPQQAQQHPGAGHVARNGVPSQMLPPGDAPLTQMGHNSAAESLSLQLAQLRDATTAATAAGELHQQQKRRLSSGHVPSHPGLLPASMQPPHPPQHAQLALPEFNLAPEAPAAVAAGMGGGDAGMLHHAPLGLQAVYSQQLQSHPLSPEQQHEQHRSPGSGHLY